MSQRDSGNGGGFHGVWLALSTPALPTGVHNVVVLADGDDTGEAARRTVQRCGGSEKVGAHASLVRRRGLTFNDLLMSCSPR